MKRRAVASRQLALAIDGVPTDVVISVFREAVFIVVTQRDKIGHLFEGTCDGGEADTRTYSINTLLGSRSDVVAQIYARQVVALVTERSSHARVVLAIALREAAPPRSTLEGLLAVLRANTLWTDDDADRIPGDDE